MSDAVVLFKSANADTWTIVKTVDFDPRRTTIEAVHLGAQTIEFHHTLQTGHNLLLTAGEEKAFVWPSGGNKLDGTVPENHLGIGVVDHYDVPAPNGDMFRIYHAQSKKDRWR